MRCVPVLALVSMLLGASAGSAATPVTFTPLNSLEGIEFAAVSSGWLDPGAAIDKQIQEHVTWMRARRPGYKITPAGRAEIIRSMAENDQYKLFTSLNDQPSLVTYRLGIYLPEGCQMIFQGREAIRLKVRRADGVIVTIADGGIICPHRAAPLSVWDDTRKGRVVFTSQFNAGKPGDWPNIAIILLPRALLGSEVLEVMPTERLEIVHPQGRLSYK